MGGPGSGKYARAHLPVTGAAAQAAEKRLYASWRRDHALFVEQAILATHNAAKGTAYAMTGQQREASAALSKLVSDKERGRSRGILGLSIMSGKGTGKDAWTAWAILWFLSLFPNPKIPCVSVSADQLHKVLWSELSKWKTHFVLKDRFRLLNDKLYDETLPEIQERGKRWLAFPKAANPKDSREEQVEGLAGIHEDYLLQVVDEGSGVLPPVFEALEGNMTGEVNLMLLIFNPTRSRGYAVETQQEQADRWIALRWNAEESELVQRASIEGLERKYGRESNTYRIRVLGLPPITDEQTLIPWDWIEEAVGREVFVPDGTPLIKGVDCGAGGDHSIIATRRGPVVYPLKRLKTPESTILANWVGTDIDAERPDVVRVDTLGIGWAIEGALREKKGAMVEAADVRRMADEPDRFLNKRAEMYWRLRDAFERGAISLPEDAELQNQLGAMRCEYDNKGRVKIVEKKVLKREIGHSPDEADALALTYFAGDGMVSRTLARRQARPTAAVATSPQAWLGA